MVRVRIVLLCVISLIVFIHPVTASGESWTKVRQTNYGFPITQYGRLLLVENGRCVFLEDSPIKGQLAHKINVVDSTGKLSVSLDPLKQIDKATDLSVYDVSIGKSGKLAVSLVATSLSSQFASLLLVYDSEGRLLTANKLPAGGEMGKLKVDDDDSIWGLRLGAAVESLETTPLFSKFTGDGKVEQDYFDRKQFRLGRRVHSVVPRVGVLSFGLTTNKVWAWIPETQELIIFSKNGTDLQRLYTDLPPFPRPELDRVRVHAAFMMESGYLIAPVAFTSTAGSSPSVSLARWSPTRQWETLAHEGIENLKTRLVGIDGNNLIFVPLRGELVLSWESNTIQ
jgi:hypothetical protein